MPKSNLESTQIKKDALGLLGYTLMAFTALFLYCAGIAIALGSQTGGVISIALTVLTLGTGIWCVVQSKKPTL